MVVERVAHGGHCVARLHATDGPGRVIFVRHALPGERVVVEITEGTDGDRFWRGDAVEVAEPSPDRVVAALPVLRPRPVRGLRLPARDAGAAAVAQGGRGPRAALEAGRPRARGERGGRARQASARAGRAALADPAALRRAARRPAGDAQAPVARGGRGRRLPDRRPSGRPRRARHRVRGRGRRLLAGAPRRPRGARRHRAGLPGTAAGGVGARPLRRRRAVRAVPGRRRGRLLRRDAGRGRPARLRARGGERARRHGPPG